MEIGCYFGVEGIADRYARAISFAGEDKTRTRYISLRPGETLRLVRSRQKNVRARMAEGDTDNKKSWDIK